MSILSECCASEHWVMVPKPLLPSLLSPFLSIAGLWSANFSHWRLFQKLLQPPSSSGWVPVKPMLHLCSQPLLPVMFWASYPLFWSLPVMVSLVFDFWSVAEYYSVIYIYQVETYLFTKNFVFSFLKKAYFITVWGKIDESECYEEYARLGNCMKRFYMFSGMLFTSVIIHMYLRN